MDINEAIQILEENGYVLEEGRLGRMLATGALAGAALFGGAHATEAPANNHVKEISSTVFNKEIQKEFNIKNVTLDAKMVSKLGENIKAQIKQDWESFGYDNTLITKTDGWAKAIEIRDTLSEVSPWLCNLFRSTINAEMHNKLKVTPIL